MFITGTMATIFHLFLTPTVKNTDLNPQEWAITTEQILKECRQAHSVKVKNNGQLLEMTNSLGETIRYEPYQTTIRKRVNRKGHVPILQHIKRVNFIFQHHQVMMEVISLSDQKYRATFSIYQVE
ncbi:competence type IV pilus minor pilin ComGF [Bacillus changyiensis]|uniref:competence type IV pilus minor pilin ComGF n=1 Tax=Bacillus changyiensis TaxID=3004103 RepID=UPI0022E5DA16|nr:competence type IV pilus minor pilin ComGF [Bacillus changyiensis]MDA1474857.1 competence type IV pilus minor pilin ComGF [Bacillus changyiensis]